MRYFFIFSLLSSLTISMAQDGSKAELSSFCFPPSTSLSRVKASLSPLLLKSDQPELDQEGNCFKIMLNQRRHQLFYKYLSQRFPDVQDLQSELMIPDQCRIEVREVSRLNSQGQSAKVNPLQLSAGAQGVNQNQGSESTTSLVLQSGLSGKLSVNGQSIDITCIKLAGQNYQVSLQMESAQQHKFSTTLTVTEGQEINLGQQVQDLERQQKELSLTKGITAQADEGKKEVEYFLKVIK